MIRRGSIVWQRDRKTGLKAEGFGPGVVLYQCGEGGIQRTGAEPEGDAVSVVEWEEGGTSRMPTRWLVTGDALHTGAVK